MPDDKTNTSAQDRSRIALGEEYEVAYWTDRFGIGEQQLRDAVAAVGNSVAAVEQHLKR